MTIQLLAGDARDVLPTLAADSVHTCVTSPPYYALRSYLDAAHPDKHREIGSEPTPDAYLATMVAVFREVRRVLRPDGTCWVNLGDSYASGTKGSGGPTPKQATNAGSFFEARRFGMGGAKPKDLLLMPARLALALQADGWWVRSDIIWHKPNPMPESCTDRPTSAHEHVFLLTKSARYWYDAEAVREEAEYGYSKEVGAAIWDRAGNHVRSTTTPGNGGTRNLRNVWTLATQSFPDSHFATFPTALAERCIRAGTSERGACSQCGKPRGRVTDVERRDTRPALKSKYGGLETDIRATGPGNIAFGLARRTEATVTTTGWAPGCDHNAEVVPCRVLDPFFGAGTTGLVAERLQRDCIGIDLNPDYNVMSRARIEADAPLFTSFPPAEDPEESRMADLFAGDEYQQMPAAVPKPQRVPTGWDTGPGAHGTIHRNGRTMPEAAE